MMRLRIVPRFFSKAGLNEAKQCDAKSLTKASLTTDQLELGLTEGFVRVLPMKRQVCTQCRKASVLCICSVFPEECRARNRTRISILQHPAEQDHHLGSARIALLGLTNVELIVVPEIQGSYSYRVRPKVGPSCSKHGAHHDCFFWGCATMDPQLPRSVPSWIQVAPNAALLFPSERALDLQALFPGVTFGARSGADGGEDHAASSDQKNTLDRTRLVQPNQKQSVVHRQQDSTGYQYGHGILVVRQDEELQTGSGDQNGHEPQQDTIVVQHDSLHLAVQGTNCSVHSEVPGQGSISHENGFVEPNGVDSRLLEAGDISDDHREQSSSAHQVQQGSSLDRSAGEVSIPEQLIVLDGTWSKAKRLYMENPWLMNLPHYKLPENFQSMYASASVRSEPKAGCMSTVEGIVYALKALEPETEGLDYLLDSFETMMQQQHAYMIENKSKSTSKSKAAGV